MLELLKMQAEMKEMGNKEMSLPFVVFLDCDRNRG
jgi:hypothetical protein